MRDIAALFESAAMSSERHPGLPHKGSRGARVLFSMDASVDAGKREEQGDTRIHSEERTTMKIVCGACGRKYSIADEKVQGKVFKIRCRNCSNVIVVKGNSQGAESDAAAAGAAGGGFGAETSSAAEWYVVIDGEQKGPLTAEEIEARFTVGQIQADSYIWRDGMGDWQHVSALDQFAHLTASSGHADEATMIAESPLSGAGDDAALTRHDDEVVVSPVDKGAQNAAEGCILCLLSE